MNARKISFLLAVLTAASVSTTIAAVNNVNARGKFVPMGSHRVTSNRTYYHRSYQPATTTQVVQMPAVTTAPTPMAASGLATTSAPAIASAPTEGRRFSYAPDAAANQAPAATPMSTPPTTRTYAARPSHTYRNTTSHVERWQLPKTDPRKYTTN